MANTYNSVFSGEHNDEYDSRIKTLENGLINLGSLNSETEEHKVIFFGNIYYGLIDPSHTTEVYLQELLKYLCAQYPNKKDAIFIGTAHPNSQGTTMIQIYNTSTVSGGLPQYSSGMYVILSTSPRTIYFGTSNYTFYIRDEWQPYGFVKWGSVTLNASTTSSTKTITLNTTGRPVFCSINGDINPGATETTWMRIFLYRDGTLLAKQTVQSNTSSTNVPFNLNHLDIVSAGSHTYTATLSRGAGTLQLAEEDANQSPRFIAYEI